MRRIQFAVALLLLSLPLVCSAGIVPTTTLAAQTNNNTSAANSFLTQTNGNLGAGNVSKVDVHTLLYSGATTKVYAHLLLWFGGSNHMNVGYNSDDPAQVKRQIADMISRGIDGVIIDWYGPNNSIDQATQLVMAEAENHPGFTFAIMVDQGALKWDSCPGCSPQQALTSQMQYIEQKYFPSSAYMRREGKPVVTNFNIDLAYSIDWNALDASLSTHPLFLFQDNGGFTHTLSGGSYSWVMPTTTDYGMSYLSSFYATGNSFPSEDTVGAAYKGFNDTLAAWGSNRIMQQQCGQTWLRTFSEIKGLYNSGKQLQDLQLVTWNDYEEGTEIESGIDNCVALSPSVTGQALQWNISGNESTVDHYTVYVSADGQNLMHLTDTAPGIRSVNLCSFSIPGGKYQVFVQAVGKPGLANRMPGPLSYTSSCSGGSSSNLSFAASPSALTIGAGKSGSLTVSAKAQSGSFNSTISLSCSGLPSTLRCAFSPATITPGSGTATSTLTISAASVSGMNLSQRKWNALYASWILPFGFLGIVSLGLPQRRRMFQAIAIVALLGISLISISCGAKTVPSQSATALNSYTVSVNGSSTSAQVSTAVTVTVQ
jgi:hypothetical protein